MLWYPGERCVCVCCGIQVRGVLWYPGERCVCVVVSR